MSGRGKRKITPKHIFYDKPKDDKSNYYETGIDDYEF